MAKQKDGSKKEFKFTEISKIFDDLAKSTSLIVERDLSKKETISTGIYILNAVISGSLFGGVKPGIITFGGDSGTGKSYIAYTVCAQAQKAGYSILYIDTEFAIEKIDLTKYGMDISEEKLTLLRTNKIEDITFAVNKYLEQLREIKKAGDEIPKTMIVLDSIGQLSSNQELNNILDVKIKADMQKAKATSVLFRSITSDIAWLDIPMICLNQTYETMDLFPQTIMKSGKQLYYSSYAIFFLTKSKLKEEEFIDELSTGQTGITVKLKAYKNRAAKPKTVTIDISHENATNPYVSLDAFCKPEWFDRIGIAQGKMDVDKKTGEMKFTPGGNRWYVRHLGKSVTTRQLFTAEVFTPEVLKNMEPIVNEYFRYKSVDEIDAIEKQFNEFVEESDQFGNIDLEDMDGSDLFS